MIAIIARSLRGRRVRTFLAVSGIATSTLLVLILAASFRSVKTAMASYAGQQAVDLWIAPAGSDNLIRGSFSSQLELDLVDSIRAIDGVARADPIIKGFLGIHPTGSRDPNRRLTLLAIGYRAPDGLGGPPGFFEGTAPVGRREIALDRAAAFRMQVGVGDTVVLGNRKVAVSGLTTGTNLIATQFMFAEFTAAAARVGVRQKASLILVQFAPGVSSDSVTRAIEQRFPEVYVYPRIVFARANEREITAGFLPLLVLVATLGISAACLLVGLLVISVIDERRNEMAVLLALGAHPTSIAQGVIIHTARMLGLGIAIGLTLAWALTYTLYRTLPTIPLALSLSDALLVALIFGVAGTGAAVVPLAHLRSIDALEAFRP